MEEKIGNKDQQQFLENSGFKGFNFTYQLRNGGKYNLLQQMKSTKEFKSVPDKDQEKFDTSSHQAKLLAHRFESSPKQESLNPFEEQSLKFNIFELPIDFKKTKPEVSTFNKQRTSSNEITKVLENRKFAQQKCVQSFKSTFLSSLRQAFASSLAPADIIIILQKMDKDIPQHQPLRNIYLELARDLQRNSLNFDMIQQDITIIRTLLTLSQCSSFQTQIGGLFLQNLIFNRQTKLVSLIHKENFKINRLFKKQQLDSQLQKMETMSQDNSDSLSEFTIIGNDQLESSNKSYIQSQWDCISEKSAFSETIDFQKQKREIYKINVSWIQKKEKGQFQFISPSCEENIQQNPFDILTFDWIYVSEQEEKLIVRRGNKQNYCFSDYASILIYQLGQGEALVQWKKSQFQDYSSRSIATYPSPLSFLASGNTESVWSSKVRLNSTKSVKLRMRTGGFKLRFSVDKSEYEEIVNPEPIQITKKKELETSSIIAVFEGE